MDWRERITLAVAAGGFRADVTGEGAGELPRDESHLILRSALVGLSALGIAVPGLRLTARNTIPHGRGLGSSSAAIVGGLAGAGGLAYGSDAELDRGWLLQHAAALEGHPDNGAAAIHGGFVVAYRERGGVAVAEVPVHPEVQACVLVPAGAVATTSARGLLPATVPHRDAAANAGRAALLVHALSRQPDLLYEGTRDWLHQSYREPAMPRSYGLMDALREEGFAAVISGAGPAVLVLGRPAELARLDRRLAAGFAVRQLAVGTGVQTLRNDLAYERRTPSAST